MSEEPKLELIALPPVIFVTPLAIGILAHFLFSLPRLPFEPVSGWLLGAVSGAAGIALILWAARTFAAHDEDPHPTEPTATIVESGPYRHSRNPMYISMALIATGIALALRSYAALASVPISLALIHFLVVRREEAHLDVVLGEPYRAFRARVRRYF